MPDPETQILKLFLQLSQNQKQAVLAPAILPQTVCRTVLQVIISQNYRKAFEGCIIIILPATTFERRE